MWFQIAVSSVMTEKRRQKNESPMQRCGRWVSDWVQWKNFWFCVWRLTAFVPVFLSPSFCHDKRTPKQWWHIHYIAVPLQQNGLSPRHRQKDAWQKYRPIFLSHIFLSERCDFKSRSGVSWQKNGGRKMNHQCRADVGWAIEFSERISASVSGG